MPPSICYDDWASATKDGIGIEWNLHVQQLIDNSVISGEMHTNNFGCKITSKYI